MEALFRTQFENGETPPLCKINTKEGAFFYLFGDAVLHNITGRDAFPLVKEGSLFFALAFPERCIFFTQ